MTISLILLLCVKFALLSKAQSAVWGDRIIGGQEIEEGTIPYQVSLRTLPRQHFCSGVILSNRTIITSAYCLSNHTSDKFYVVVGTNSLESGGTAYNVSEVKIYPYYDSVFKFDDLSLIYVTKDIEFNGSVQPIELNSSETDGNESVTLSGWGKTSICTYTQVGEGICDGDFGGPVTLNNKLVGIISWSSQCAMGLPDVHTRISSHVEWIRNNLI